MKLKNREISTIAQALRLLDGNDKKEYKFAWRTRVSVAKKMRIAAEYAADMEKVRLDLVDKHQVGKSKTNDAGEVVACDTPEDVRAYNKEYNSFLDAEVEIEIGKFLMKDLDLETNSIPMGVLSALLPIITDEE
jgi:hypothetical protein